MVVTASVTSTSHTVCACSCLLLLLSVWASVGIVVVFMVLGFCLQVGSQSVSCKVLTVRISHLFSLFVCASIVCVLGFRPCDAFVFMDFGFGVRDCCCFDISLCLAVMFMVRVSVGVFYKEGSGFCCLLRT